MNCSDWFSVEAKCVTKGSKWVHQTLLLCINKFEIEN